MLFLLVNPPFWMYVNSLLGNNWHSRAGLLSLRGHLPALVRLQPERKWGRKPSASLPCKNQGWSFDLSALLHRYLQDGEQNVYHEPNFMTYLLLSDLRIQEWKARFATWFHLAFVIIFSVIQDSCGSIDLTDYYFRVCFHVVSHSSNSFG